MKWFVLFVGVIVVCFFVALVLGLVGGGMGRATSSLSHEPLPDDELHDPDLDELRFDVGLRGYRMSQVDGVVDRLRRELREKDEQIAVLRSEPDVPTLGGVAQAPADPESDAAGSAEPTHTEAVRPVEPNDAQASDAQANDGQANDGQANDGQASGGQAPDARANETQTGQRHGSEPTV